MARHRYLVTAWVGSLVVAFASQTLADVLPTGGARPPLEFKHFPSRLHTFVWRNWELVSLERMAGVLDTTPETVRELGRSMGLPSHKTPPAQYLQRGYISIIRRNWHILPYEQLLELLGWDAEKLAFTLREDDFLWIKLGSLKPSCSILRYTEPDDVAIRRCREIREIVSSHFASEFDKPWQPRFGFLEDLSTVHTKEASAAFADRAEKIRFLYSYSGVFGDPLVTSEPDPYPDGLLQQLSDLGVNGVWLHVVLRQLAPSAIFPEFGAGHEQRIANLRRLADRAKKYGIDIYLYMNEPRAMEASFFKGREGIRGVRVGDHFTMCTSCPEVRQWLSDSLTYVFKQVPRLGGIFTITASENLTNCYSHSRTAAECPRCSKRSGPEVIAEVNRAMAAGVWAGSPEARVIVWDWGWPDGTSSGWGKPDWAQQIIPALPDGVHLMSVSEWSKPIVRGGVATSVGEYSISAVGPGPRAQKHWGLAKSRGLKTLAKVQANCSWELSAVPYLPVMNLVAQHCRNLAEADVDGLMLSWSVGGYPSPNLELVNQFSAKPLPTVDQALRTVAESRYSANAASDVLRAWSLFSEAFREYPFHGGFVYRGPVQYGPANLLYPEPTGYGSTMVGFPYDDLDGWRAVYPADVLARQFERIAEGWHEGLTVFERAAGKPRTLAQRANLRADLGIAEVAGLHFSSVASQIRFVIARNALLSHELNDAECEVQIGAIAKTVASEIDNAKRLFRLTCEDSRIGFEASNHYYYLPLDLVEKVVNCEYIRSDWLKEVSRL